MLELPDRPGDEADRRQGEPADGARAVQRADRAVKWLLRAAGVAVALVAIALAVLAWALPRLASSDAARAKIQAAARAALGRELHYGKLGFGLLPPSLLVEDASIAGESEGAPPLAKAGRVALRVELWPLLRGQLEVASLAIDGLALHLVRTQDGLVLPGRGESPEKPPEPEPEQEPAPEDEGGLAFGIRKIALTRRLARARGPQRLTREDVERRRHRPHRAERRRERAGRDRGIARGREGRRARGRRRALARSQARPARRGSERAVHDRRARCEPALRRRLRKARGHARRAARPHRAGRGRRARGRGSRARAAQPGRARRAAHRAEDRAPLAADAFDLADGMRSCPRSAWPSRAAGSRSRSSRCRPIRSRCAARSRSTRSSRRCPTWRRWRSRGAVELLGSDLRTRDLVARAADQPIRVDARVAQLFDGAALRDRVRDQRRPTPTRCSRASAKQPDRLEGPLDLKGTLRGTTAGEAVVPRRALGRHRARHRGRADRRRHAARGGARIARCARERRAAPAGRQGLGALHDRPLRVAARHAPHRARPARDRHPSRSTYPDWGAQLEGPIRLADLALDLTGRLTIGEALDAALARAFGARSGYVPEKRTIELASVRGQLGAPKVQLAGKSIATIAAAYAGAGPDRRAEEARREGARPGQRRAGRSGPRSAEGRARRKEAVARSRRRSESRGDFPSSFVRDRRFRDYSDRHEESPGCPPASSTSTTTGTCVRSSRKRSPTKATRSAPATTAPRRSRSSASICPT